MTTKTPATPVCSSCSFGPGYRTGEIHAYVVTACVGDYHVGDKLDLCDDCAGRALHALTLADA